MIDVHPSAVVDKTVELGDDVRIGPNCVVQQGTTVGDGTIIEANVIGPEVTIGKNNRFHSTSVIGNKPQIMAMDRDAPVGRLTIGDGNTIREQVTIHPSMFEGKLTSIGSNNFLMIGVHIGHDCLLEDNIVMSNYSQVSGHCKVEAGVWLSGGVLLNQFVTLGKWCYAAGLAGLNSDVTPFMIISGHYPSTVRTVNKRGMSRAGLDDNQQQAVMDAFKKLYRNGQPLLENARALVSQDGLDENVRAIAENIINSSKHRHGRYLETFREH